VRPLTSFSMMRSQRKQLPTGGLKWLMSIAL
jgi:hypothetical protein